jgi:hypothetical protein
MDPGVAVRCREKLVEVARQERTITYGELAAHIGIENQGPWAILDEIYNEETAAQRPDLTLLIVYADTGYPPFISRGGPARSVKFDPNKHLEAWATELAKAYAFYGEPQQNV